MAIEFNDRRYDEEALARVPKQSYADQMAHHQETTVRGAAKKGKGGPAGGPAGAPVKPKKGPKKPMSPARAVVR